MSNIKNLKSGSVPAYDDGNSVLPSVEVKLEFGVVDTKLLIQQQTNKITVAQAQRARIKKGP